jgi:hypothetical protein
MDSIPYLWATVAPLPGNFAFCEAVSNRKTENAGSESTRGEPDRFPGFEESMRWLLP